MATALVEDSSRVGAGSCALAGIGVDEGHYSIQGGVNMRREVPDSNAEDLDRTRLDDWPLSSANLHRQSPPPPGIHPYSENSKHLSAPV